MRTKGVVPVAILLGAFMVTPGSAANPLADGLTTVNRCASLRLGESCEPEPASAEHNQAVQTLAGNQVVVTRKLELPAQQSAAALNLCQANFSTSYYQRNNRVHVETVIENVDCEASHGEFMVRIRTMGDSGETSTQSFTESWSRTGQSDVLHEADYSIADGRRVVWARTKANSATACSCSQNAAGLEAEQPRTN